MTGPSNAIKVWPTTFTMDKVVIKITALIGQATMPPFAKFAEGQFV